MNLTLMRVLGLHDWMARAAHAPEGGDGTAETEALVRRGLAIRAATRLVLEAEGCKDVDVAMKLGEFAGIKLTDAGEVDIATVKASVGAFKAAKAYLFGEATAGAAPADKPKSALDMTHEEYAASKRAFLQGSASRLYAPKDLGTTKSALDMTDEEYRAVRRRLGVPSSLEPGGVGKEPPRRGPAATPQHIVDFFNRKPKLYP